MSDEQQIADGARVQQFLEDPAVQRTLDELAERYVREWKAGTDPAMREAAWAKSRALDDLRVGLQAVMDAGTRATADRKRRERGR